VVKIKIQISYVSSRALKISRKVQDKNRLLMLFTIMKSASQKHRTKKRSLVIAMKLAKPGNGFDSN
jgi:hypothetical protein